MSLSRSYLLPLLLVSCTTQVGGGDFVDDTSTPTSSGFPDAGAEPEADPEADAMPTTPVGGPCGEGSGHIEYGGQCYEFFAATVRRDVARQNCMAIGGDLAVIEDATTNSVVTSIIPSSVAEVWLLGTDVAAEGSWVWEGEGPLQFSNWRSGEPNNGNGNEHCMVLERNRGGTWDDRPCSNNYQYMCGRVPGP